MARRTIVSIHAPAWGATEYEEANYREELVSIHAPAWGATKTNMDAAFADWFQSTPPRGGRLQSVGRHA